MASLAGIQRRVINVGIFFEDLSGEILQDDELARLLTFPNVLVTAHQAFLTHEALSEIARITVENVRRFMSKQDLLSNTPSYIYSNTLYEAMTKS
jgi:phosphoglycerate dehydrogenase-like enzyme